MSVLVDKIIKYISCRHVSVIIRLKTEKKWATSFYAFRLADVGLSISRWVHCPLPAKVVLG